MPRTSWNKGLKIGDRIRKKKLYLAKPCLMCEKPVFSYPSVNQRFCNMSCRSRYHSHPSRNRWVGKRMTDEQRLTISIAHIGVQAGSKHPLWKGGKTRDTRQADMQSYQYKQWRFAVFTRDKFACVQCKATRPLQADHIKPYAQFVDLRYDVSNGRTLCVSCHRKTPTWGNRRTVAA